MRAAVVLGGCLGVAALSLLVPAAPDYDPWSWLVWGREAGRLELSTAGGPAFKPLPVAVTTVLALAGDAAAPQLWLLVARAAAAAAVVLAFAAARRLAGGSVVAGAAAAAGVLLTGGFVHHAAVGNSEPLLLALALAAALCAADGRHGPALALGVLAALVRVEAWPYLALYGAWCAWRRPRLRAAVALAAIGVPAAWFVPEWLGSGDVLRSGDRALVPNPGAPALADAPALESLRRAAGLVPLPVAAGLAAALVARHGRAAALPAAAGAGWLLLVAVMAQAGFSGEERYAVPGAGLLAVTAGAGLAWVARRGRPATAAVVLLVAGAGALAAAGVPDGAARLRAADELAADLRAVVPAAGGREHLLACGRPAVGRYRGPMLAYALDVPRRAVRADGAPAAVTFRSRLRTGPVTPPAPPRARRLAAVGRWTVVARCAGPPPARAPRPAAGRPPR
jgi:hypothetical protein